MCFLSKDLYWPPCHHNCVALWLEACLQQARLAPAVQQPCGCVWASPRLLAELTQHLWVGWARGVWLHVRRPGKILYRGRSFGERHALRLQAV